MGNLAVHEFMALDGVFEDPSWTMEFGFDPKMGDSLAELTDVAGGILLGRTTFDMFAPAWSTRTADDDPGAPFFNDSTKHVVSASLTDAEAEATWRNSTALGAYDADTIRALKESVDGDLYVSGSGTLFRALLADGLVDALHLFVFPVVLGRGRRLFDEDGSTSKLALLQTEVYDNGVVHLGYGPA